MSFLIANPFIKATAPAPAPAPEPPFSLEALQAAWPDPPRFTGKRKLDPPVSKWLSDVAEGCRAHDVARKHWPTVARALMGEKALLRLIEFERVLSSMEGGDAPAAPSKDQTTTTETSAYDWTWERFEVAVGSMGWEVSRKKTRAFTIAAKKCGRWWVVGKKADAPPSSTNPTVGALSPVLPTPSVDDIPTKKSFFGGHSKLVSEPASTSSSLRECSDEDSEKEKEKEKASTMKVRRTPIRAMSDSLTSVFRPGPKATMDSNISEWEDVSVSFSTVSDSKPSALTAAPTQSQVSTSSALVPSPPIMPPAPRRSNTEPVQTTITHAPDWLVGAVGALDFLTSNHPRAMSALSAVLLTVGSVPVMAASGGAAAVFPALAATPGGHAVLGVLGSASAQAVGAVVVGLGNWVKSVNEGQVQVSR